MGQSRPLTVYRPSQRGPAATLTLGAAAINLSVAPDHLKVYVPFAVLLIAVGIAQAVLGLAAWLRPSRGVFTAAVLIALVCLVVWTISRTAGLPVGPAPGRPEAAGFPDLVTTLFEVTSVPLFLILIWRGPRYVPDRRRGWPGGVVPLAVLLTLLTFVGVMTGLNPLPYAVNMSTAPAGPGVTGLQMLTEPPGDQPVRAFTLTAEVAHLGGHELWTYNGAVPGPELRVTQGDRLRVTLINHLPAATTIHWHGLRLPNAEDGVAGLTQQALAPGQTYTYEFVVRDRGTYWYHSHQDTEHQVPKGLYGALVVLPREGPTYARDYAIAVGDLNGSDAGERSAVNGITGDLHLDAQPGELVRLRVIDAIQGDMTGFPELLTLLGAPYRVIALDGHDLNGPTERAPELLPIGIGQRYDLALPMPPGGKARLVDNRAAQGSQHARTWTVTLGEGAVPPPVTVSSRFDLTTYGTPASDAVAQRQTFDAS